ncbi:MAG: hypothetical protein NTY51_07360 [Deltaproteobacteria bacterium]|nr:hypothetical protein [Deltaproteobacteria bacterium]
MAKKRKPRVWMPPTPKRSKPAVPDHLREDVTLKANELVQKHLKPAHIKPPPTNPEINYMIDIWTRWYQSYFYFCATYASPSPHALSPTFELRFARMAYIGNERFNLVYMRHTGQWNEIYFDLSVEECLTAIRDEPFFLH